MYELAVSPRSHHVIGPLPDVMATVLPSLYQTTSAVTTADAIVVSVIITCIVFSFALIGNGGKEIVIAAAAVLFSK